MILVGQYDSPYVRRVAIALHLLGIPFERNTMSVFADADAMRRINPVGRIPALILDDGEVLIDSAAILDHLDETVGPERAMAPPRGAARRRILRLTALASGTLDKAGAVVYEHAVRPAATVYQPWVDRCRTQLDSGLAALEAETGDGYYLGDRPTHADVMAGCLIGYLRLRLRDALGDHPRLARLTDTLDALPAFVQTRPAADEVMPVRPT
jgi:glutathione S-transferase